MDCQLLQKLQINFNTLAHAGETQMYILYDTIIISIHSPMRARRFSIYCLLVLMLFQYTRPCGRDRSLRFFFYPFPNFNTLAHAGETKFKGSYFMISVISIHSPMRARQNLKKLGIYSYISIHSPMRARLICMTRYRDNDLFQYTRPCGRDVIKWIRNILNDFNTLAHAGETRRYCTDYP